MLMSKLVTLLIAPLGTAMVLLLLGLVAGWRGQTRRATLATALALGWLWLWSMPVVTDCLLGWIESQSGARVLTALPQAEAIVVLGGGVRVAYPPERPDPDLGDAADRVWYAARLYHAGKAPVILASGGNVIPGMSPEARAMRRILMDFGVPDGAILLEEASRNTSENARYASRLLRDRGIRKVLLVTSALHMRRARARFVETGLQVIPAPTDFRTIKQPFMIDQVLPDSHALLDSAQVLKELLGVLVER